MTTSSKFNKSIIIEEFRGSVSLIVNGILQSGDYVTDLYNQVFSAFSISLKQNAKILVLGVGGGTVIHKCLSIQQNIQITGVDIDSRIITIAKKYFNLDKANIKFIHQDAKIYIRENSEVFDMVIVDLFIGNDIPEFVEQKEFIHQISLITKKRGKLLINFQRMNEYKQRARKLQNSLTLIFSSVKAKSINRNYFFYANNQ